MYKLMSTERRSEVSDEEIPDDESDFFVPEEDWDEDEYEDDEPEEREYCD